MTESDNKIVVLDGYTLNPGDLSWDRLKGFGELEVYDRTPPEEVVQRIGDAQIVFTNKTPLTEELLTAAKNLKYIGVLATGYNVVDVAAANKLNITVTNIPTYGTASVAQYVFALLLEICHHVGSHSDAVRKGAWENCPDFCFWNYPLIELAGKTMGIIGFGRIGQNTARIAQSFGMKVLAYDEYPNKAFENEQLKYVALNELFKQADVISLHCPLFENTRNIINEKNISSMKDGVIIINTSRGPLIDEEALAAALNSGKVFGAAVDVVSAEPIKGDNPLLKAKNCIITPHIAWAPKESRTRLMEIAADNLEKFLTGTPANIVSV